MKNRNAILILFCILHTQNLFPKRVPASEIKVWLELDAVRQKAQAQIRKNLNRQAEITNETNAILEYGIQAANDLGTDDQNAVLAIYYDMQKLKNETKQMNQDIDIINKKNKLLSNYVDQQIKELTDARRKHLQFP